MRTELLELELEKLTKLRHSLNRNTEVLTTLQKEFNRTNRELLHSIEITQIAITESEQKLYSIAKDIYSQISFYLDLEEPPLEKPVLLHEDRKEGEDANRNVLNYFRRRR